MNLFARYDLMNVDLQGVGKPHSIGMDALTDIAALHAEVERIPRRRTDASVSRANVYAYRKRIKTIECIGNDTVRMLDPVHAASLLVDDADPQIHVSDGTYTL